MKRLFQRTDRRLVALGDHPDRAIELVRHPAGETEPARLADDEIPKPDALDAAADRRFEADVGDRRRVHSGGPGTSRPAQDQHVEDELRARIRLDQLAASIEPLEEGRQLAG